MIALVDWWMGLGPFSAAFFASGRLHRWVYRLSPSTERYILSILTLYIDKDDNKHGEVVDGGQSS